MRNDREDEKRMLLTCMAGAALGRPLPIFQEAGHNEPRCTREPKIQELHEACSYKPTTRTGSRRYSARDRTHCACSQIAGALRRLPRFL